MIAAVVIFGFTLLVYFGIRIYRAFFQPNGGSNTPYANFSFRPNNCFSRNHISPMQFLWGLAVIFCCGLLGQNNVDAHGSQNDLRHVMNRLPDEDIEMQDIIPTFDGYYVNAAISIWTNVELQFF